MGSGGSQATIDVILEK
jgi:hypothetical protein